MEPTDNNVWMRPIWHRWLRNRSLPSRQDEEYDFQVVHILRLREDRLLEIDRVMPFQYRHIT